MRPDTSDRRAWTSLLLPTWCIALAGLILGPALAPGYVLTYDMVFVPRLDLTRDTLGLGGALPRAVPVDAVTALLTSVLPGDVLQKAVLLATLSLAGFGASRLLPDQPRPVRAVAATVYVWNPYVAERLVLGHWALLVAYAVLPWLVIAARDMRGAKPGALPRTVLLLAISALTPTGGLLGILVALPIVAWPPAAGRVRSLASLAGAAVLVNAPWWLPGLLHDPTGAATGGVDAFSARGENVLGPVGALLGLGGVWNAQVVPDSRGTVLGVASTLLLLGLAAAGASELLRRTDRGAVGGLVVAAALGLAVAVTGVLPGSRVVLAELVDRVPAAGVLRDGQKWIAPYALLLAPAVALGVARLAARARDAALGNLAAVGAIVALLAVLPDLGLGAAGRLQAVDYPQDWHAVRAAVEREPGHGDVAVLPWGTFRAFGWNDGRTVLDPATRFLPGSVVASSDLVVGRVVVAGDDPRAVAVRAAFDRPDSVSALRGLGVGWVLVEKDQAGAALREPEGEVRYDGELLRLVQLADASDRPWPPHAALVVVLDLLVLLLVVICAGLAVLGIGGLKSPRRRLPAGRVPPPGQS